MLNLNDLKLLQFKASWCGPCTAQSKEFSNNKLDINLEPIDIEEKEELCDKYNIKSSIYINYYLLFLWLQKENEK